MCPRPFLNGYRCRKRLNPLSTFPGSYQDLPWRSSPNPYRVVVSEFMLQQTQVDTVIPYYRRFLEAFPDIGTLARAPLPDVLKVWEGLGYYARARNLHKAAKAIVSEFNGLIPTDRESMARLPGFGPYTTSAVLSIAFNQNWASVDGNVIRVLCRVFGIEGNVSQSRVKTRISDLAQSLLPRGRARDFNQAAMELGALVCKPKAPSCGVCPLSRICSARAAGTQERIPLKSRKRARPHYEEAVGMVRRKDGRFLIARRQEEGLLGGLWELPGGRREKGETLADACVRGVREEVGAKVLTLRRLRSINHGFTHFRLTIHPFSCKFQSGPIRPLNCAEVAWIEPEALGDYAFSSAHRRLTERMKDER